jgi:hypothetical protein
VGAPLRRQRGPHPDRRADNTDIAAPQPNRRHALVQVHPNGGIAGPVAWLRLAGHVGFPTCVARRRDDPHGPHRHLTGARRRSVARPCGERMARPPSVGRPNRARMGLHVVDRFDLSSRDLPLSLGPPESGDVLEQRDARRPVGEVDPGPTSSRFESLVAIDPQKASTPSPNGQHRELLTPTSGMKPPISNQPGSVDVEPLHAPQGRRFV